MKKQRKHYAPGEKVAILRRHLLPEEQKANLSISLPRGLVLRACKHHGVTEDLSACSTNVHL